MKSTGVTRQLDSLGRIVLPVELRRFPVEIPHHKLHPGAAHFPAGRLHGQHQRGSSASSAEAWPP